MRILLFFCLKGFYEKVIGVCLLAPSASLKGCLKGTKLAEGWVELLCIGGKNIFCVCLVGQRTLLTVII